MDLFLCSKWKYQSVAAVFTILNSAGVQPAAAMQLRSGELGKIVLEQQSWFPLLFLGRGGKRKEGAALWLV